MNIVRGGGRSANIALKRRKPCFLNHSIARRRDSRCVEKMIRPDVFFLPTHRTTYQSLLDMYDSAMRLT
jgi:hypothetical protein